jgi:filamentous hemagglutinin
MPLILTPFARISRISTALASTKFILNEVVDGKTSNIAGWLEVVGNKAGVIIANPYGITCNGCGFINTSRVTLTTGESNFDKGNLSFDINQGNINIGSNGLDAKAVDILDILASLFSSFPSLKFIKAAPF